MDTWSIKRLLDPTTETPSPSLAPRARKWRPRAVPDDGAPGRGLAPWMRRVVEDDVAHVLQRDLRGPAVEGLVAGDNELVAELDDHQTMSRAKVIQSGRSSTTACRRLPRLEGDEAGGVVGGVGDHVELAGEPAVGLVAAEADGAPGQTLPVVPGPVAAAPPPALVDGVGGRAPARNLRGRDGDRTVAASSVRTPPSSKRSMTATGSLM
ncbi:hypothetical protein SEVIR_4G031901v4 [Setaria viridis]